MAPVMKNEAAETSTQPSITANVKAQLHAAITTIPNTFSAVVRAEPVTKSYDEAVVQCKAKVHSISRQCRKLNIRFRDRFFDLGLDSFDCLNALYKANTPFSEEDLAEMMGRNSIGDVERVQRLYEKPQFFKDGGMLPGDIEQGAEGDCWFLAALSILASVPSLLIKCMVAHDEKVGVYGFVFHRDGQWITSIIDDQLAISFEDYKRSGSVLTRDEYDKTYLKGSRALRFAKAHDKNETWVPLIEKAYAKAHGDYESISGGDGGEAVEDLTGGVCGGLQLDDILDTDRFWKEDLMQMGKGKMFFLSMYSPSQGLHAGHEYAVLKAVEAKGKRFVLIRNPWGNSEWTGKWSDGSEEWTGEWMTLLNHRFGDDGKFWMEYGDLLKQWDYIGKATVFDSTWSVSKSNVEIEPTFPAQYSKTVFDVSITRPTQAFFVLSQIDSRYFVRFEGEYSYDLTFQIVQLAEDGTESEFAHPPTTTFSFLSRSKFVEFQQLPAGQYRVYPKVTASPMHKAASVDEIITCNGEMGRHAKVQKQINSFTLAKQVSLLRTGKLMREVTEKKEAELKATVEEEAAEQAKEEETTKSQEVVVSGLGIVPTSEAVIVESATISATTVVVEEVVEMKASSPEASTTQNASTKVTDSLTPVSQVEASGTDDDKISLELSASIFLRVFAKDSAMTVTTRFLDLELEDHVLPECLLEPDMEDPTSELYIQSSVLSVIQVDGNVEKFIVQKSKINQESGTSSVLKVAQQQEQDDGNATQAARGTRANLDASLRKGLVNLRKC